MPSGVMRGSFAHVAGTFDLADRSGTIDYVTPVQTATESDDFDGEGIHLIGLSKDGKKLFDKRVNPQRNSCAPHSQRGTFDEYVPVSPELAKMRLQVQGSTAAEFVRGRPSAPGALALGAPDPDAPYRMPVVAAAQTPPAPRVTYSVQAKPDEQPWQTLAVGLPTPDAQIDVNQFPGTKRLEVRVLQSDGFSETEVFRQSKTF